VNSDNVENLKYSYLDASKLISNGDKEFVTSREASEDKVIAKKYLKFDIFNRIYYVSLADTNGIWAKFNNLEFTESDTDCQAHLKAFLIQLDPNVDPTILAIGGWGFANQYLQARDTVADLAPPPHEVEDPIIIEMLPVVVIEDE